jgi:hypothetical protein
MSEGGSVIAGCRGLFVCSAESSPSSSLVNLNLPRYTHLPILISTIYFLYNMADVKRFFSSPRFAVAGASNDAHKFGYKSNVDYQTSLDLY